MYLHVHIGDNVVFLRYQQLADDLQVKNDALSAAVTSSEVQLQQQTDEIQRMTDEIQRLHEKVTV